MADQLPEERRIVFSNTQKEQVKVDSYQTLFRIGNFNAQYSNCISTESSPIAGPSSEAIQIDQEVCHSQTKFKKTTKLRVGDHVILINDIFEYPQEQSERLIAIDQVIEAESNAGRNRPNRNLTERRNLRSIAKSVVRHFVDWLSVTPWLSLKRKFHEHRRQLKNLLTRKQANFEELEQFLPNKQFRSILLTFLRGFNMDWHMNLTATIPISEVKAIIDDMIAKVERYEADVASSEP